MRYDATDIQAEVASKQANMNYNRQMSYSFRGKMLWEIESEMKYIIQMTIALCDWLWLQLSRLSQRSNSVFAMSRRNSKKMVGRNWINNTSTRYLLYTYIHKLIFMKLHSRVKSCDMLYYASHYNNCFYVRCEMSDEWWHKLKFRDIKIFIRFVFAWFSIGQFFRQS